MSRDPFKHKHIEYRLWSDSRFEYAWFIKFMSRAEAQKTADLWNKLGHEHPVVCRFATTDWRPVRIPSGLELEPPDEE